ncbi:MAG: hypothetical protein M1828_005829 [Chrysothrix sp. TS-e1954]|nr:MAG: hypothetical protein M1828_005829 [Chrysothrix sp. TS-e1954]
MSTKQQSNASYVQGHSPSVLAAHGSRTATALCQYLLPTLHAFPSDSSPRLLDVGCGPGSITTSFTEHLPKSAQITGMDYSEDTIKPLNADSKKPGNVTFETGDAFKLRWDDNTFDIVHTNFVLMHLSDPVSVLREMHRVCKPNGVVACREGALSTTLYHPTSPPIERWRSSYVASFKAKGNHYDEGKELVTHCLDAGFELSGITFQSANYTHTNAEKGEGAGMLEWWMKTNAKRAREDEVYRKGVLEGGFCTEQELEEMAQAFEELSQVKGGVYSVWCGCVIARKADGDS